MPTNRLRTQAARFLDLARRAHDDADAHKLTLTAAEFLEDAISIEKLRTAKSRSSATQKTA